DVVSPPVCGN
nr:RecName: Full=Zinc metalloproteinase-disintegrin-like AAV1; AltName: Full=Snake venom metalloproteinase; Short=SVMP; Contains: RecName: Full=Disintegrin-like AAV1-C [Deinagkistrodon acutus]